MVFLLVGRDDSSSPVRLFLLLDGSTRGGTNGVGEDGAVAGAEPLVLAASPLRPLTVLPPPPFLNLLCTDDRVSVKLLRSVVGVVLAAERPRLPRPFGVRVSKSLVGESQNLHRRMNGKRNKKHHSRITCQMYIERKVELAYLGGAQSCLVQSRSVPTYVFPLHVTFTTRTP